MLCYVRDLIGQASTVSPYSLAYHQPRSQLGVVLPSLVFQGRLFNVANFPLFHLLLPVKSSAKTMSHFLRLKHIYIPLRLLSYHIMMPSSITEKLKQKIKSLRQTMASRRSDNNRFLDYYDSGFTELPESSYISILGIQANSMEALLTASDSPQNMAVTKVRSSPRRSNRQHAPYNFTTGRSDLNSDEKMDGSSRSNFGSPYYINPRVGNQSSQFNGNQGNGAAGPTTSQVWNKPVTGDCSKQWNGNADIDGLKLFFK